MLLAVDIGNTTASFGILKGKKLLKRYILDQGLSPRTYLNKLAQILQKIRRGYSIKNAVVCSVVPGSLKQIEPAIKRLLKVRVLVIGQDIRVPIKNKYRSPAQVGQDRLVGAYAAKEIYGYPAIIIDFGTAITFDVVSKSGAYEGGVIVPGIRLTVESLFAKTALLPRVDRIRIPKTLIGKSTTESILSGIFNGYGALSCGLIDAISVSVKGRPKVIVTGGHTGLMKKYLKKRIHSIDKYLVFKGIYLLSCLSSSNQ